MKKMLIAALILLFLLPMPCAAADAYGELYAASGMEEAHDTLPTEIQQQAEMLMQQLTGENPTQDGMLDLLLGMLRDGFDAPKHFLLICIAAILLCSLCARIGEGTYSAPCEYISVLVIAGGGIAPLLELIQAADTAVSGVTAFMRCLIPVLAGILLAGGRVGTAGGFSALFMLATQVVGQVFSLFVLPCMCMFTSLSISCACSDLKADGLVVGIKKAVGWLLTLTLTLFTGVLGLQTTIAGASDSVAMKTVRFAAGSFLPVVGSAVGEAMGTVTTCLQWLRSTGGAYGVLCIALLLLPIILRLAAWRLALLLCEGVGSLFCAEKITQLLSSIGQAVALLIGILVWTGLLFIISLTIVMKAGGGG